MSSLRDENIKLIKYINLYKKKFPPIQKPIESHPDFAALVKRLTGAPCNHPQVVSKFRAMGEMTAKYCPNAPNKLPGDPIIPINEHPDYPILIAKHEKELLKINRNIKTDIRKHPDYEYFKSYWLSHAQMRRSADQGVL